MANTQQHRAEALKAIQDIGKEREPGYATTTAIEAVAHALVYIGDVIADLGEQARAQRGSVRGRGA